MSLLAAEYTISQYKSMALAGIICGGILLLVIVVCATVLTKYHLRNIRSTIWNFVEKNLFRIFCATWFYGFVTYFIGTFVGNVPEDNGWITIFSVVPMAAIHATSMFAGLSDISAIHGDRHEAVWFMIMFDTSHFLCLMVSLCFVLKHFGFYIESKIKLIIEGLKKGKYDNLYVFWGVNEASANLAKSIANDANMNDSRMLFVKIPIDDETGNHQLGIERLLNFVSMKDRELEKLSRLENTFFTSTFHRLSKLELEDETETIDVIGKKLKLFKLKGMVGRVRKSGDNATSGVHMFILGEDRDANINATINLLRDKSLNSCDLHIYCQARKNSKTRWMENYDLQNPDKRTKIHVIDTAFLSIASLKRDPEKHPARYVEFDDETCYPKTQFNSLIVGFGETGLEALKFLYEYSSFIADDNGNRAIGSHTVIDEKMADFKGGFYAKAPAFKHNNEVNLEQCKIDSDEYWALLSELLPRLNYVIVAIGDDSSGINVAVEICKMARRCYDLNHRRKLTVFVRSYEEDNFNRLQMVCDDINVSCKDLHISMELFGSVRQLFTYDMIVDDIIMDEAKLYNWSYQDFGKAYGQSMDVERCWEDQVLPKKDDGEEKYNMSQLEEIDRLTTQNICNSLHRGTKIYILQQSGYWEQIREWIINYMKQSNDQKKLTREWLEDKPFYPIVRRIAMLEHERWIACSKLDGWSVMSGDEIDHFEELRSLYRNKRQIDFRIKHHADVCNWNEIRKWNKEDPDSQRNTQEYDFKVVYTSVLLDSFVKKDGILDKVALKEFTERYY